MSRKEHADSLRAMLPFSQEATRETLRQAIDGWEKGLNVDMIIRLLPELLEGDTEYNRAAEDFDSMTLPERVDLYEEMKTDRENDPTLDLLMKLWSEGMPYERAHFEAVKTYFG